MCTKAISTAASASAPPPPYEQLTPTTRNTGKCTSEKYSEEWKYMTFPHPPNNCWHKIIRGPDERATEIHLGIGDKETKHGVEPPTGPDCFFVCKMAPRGNKISKQEIADVCAGIPCSARRHRGRGGGYCTCTFRDFRLGDKIHCCGRVGPWERFAKWVNARSVRSMMEEHDRLCSCGCFDASC